MEPSAIPPELVDAIEAAAAAYERLAADNRYVHFVPDARPRRVRVEVRDSAGNFLHSIAPSEALRLAEGDALDGVVR